MANCYRCGAPNANYRRTIYTGFSKGSWWSKRSYGFSSRTYYGLRSVCQDCAKKIDTWNRIKLIFWIVVVVVACYFFLDRISGSTRSDGSSQPNALYHYSGETAKVISSKGLNLRDQPNSNGIVLITIPFSETVGIIDKNGDSETISDQTANWYKVDYKGTTGWLWSGYLQRQ